MAQRSLLRSVLIGGVIGAVIGVGLVMLASIAKPLSGEYGSILMIMFLGLGSVVFGGIGCICGLLSGIARRSDENATKDTFLLPAVSEIRSMQVKSWRPDPKKAEIAFVVPEECWDAFLSVLSDADRDPHPYKWETLAELEIRMLDRQRILVGLCNLPDYPLGAIFVDSATHRHDCYRVSSTALFQQILSAAMAACKSAEDDAMDPK